VLDDDFLAGNVVQARKFPIVDQRNIKKICNINLLIKNREGSFQFTIKSSPVSETVYFTASFDFLNAESGVKLDEAKFGWTKYQRGREMQSSRSLTKFPLQTASRNLIVNVRCEVTSKFSKKLRNF
jgi:hypothetical protein